MDVVSFKRYPDGLHLILEDQETVSVAILKDKPKQLVETVRGKRKAFFIFGSNEGVPFQIYGLVYGENETGWKKLSMTFTYFPGNNGAKSKTYTAVLGIEKLEEMLQQIENHW